MYTDPLILIILSFVPDEYTGRKRQLVDQIPCFSQGNKDRKKDLIAIIVKTRIHCLKLFYHCLIFYLFCVFFFSQMEIPKVHLLPGQIIALQEIIENTQMNYQTPSSNPSSPNQIKPKLPAVTRTPSTKTFVKRQSQEDMDAGLNVSLSLTNTKWTFGKCYEVENAYSDSQNYFVFVFM